MVIETLWQLVASNFEECVVFGCLIDEGYGGEESLLGFVAFDRFWREFI